MRGNQWKKPPVADRFWEKVNRRGDSECWQWTAVLNGCGYGRFLIAHNRFALAHRMAWTLAVGPIPDGLCVCHSCDNRLCCNPAHLFLGTRADNNADRDRKGRRVEANALKTCCKRGHPFTPDNVTWNHKRDGSPVRKCRKCARAREREARIRRHSGVQIGLSA